MTQKRFVSIGECMVEMSGGHERTYRLGYAGDTLNTAWYMRALLDDAWSVDYLTALGDDRYSNDIRAFLAANRIGTAHIQTIPGKRPGLYLIHQENGDRVFTYWRDTAAARFLADDKAALGSGLDGAAMVYFSGITLAILQPRARGRLLKAIMRARDGGARIVFDTNLRPALWSSPRVMASALTAVASLCDVVLPTHTDEANLFGDTNVEATAERYLALGVEEVVVKDGGRTAYVATPNQAIRVAPHPGADVVDATGAGDAFNGAYLSARLAGRGLLHAAEAAHRVARIVIGQPGALIDPALLAG